MAGPWFTVHESGSDWQELGTVWISNGTRDCQGVIEIKVQLEQNDEEV